jgi:hypothetical protein
MIAATILALLAQEDYSNLKVGNKWHFKSAEGQEIVWIVLGKEKKGKFECVKLEVKTSVRSSIEWIQVTDEGEFLVAKDRYAFDPPYARLKTPARIGDKWEARTNVTSEVEEDKERTVSYDIIGTEDVEVPAGHWTCLKVNSTIRDPQGETQRTDWRAPGLGVVKFQLAMGGTFDLVKFEGSSTAAAEKMGAECFPLKDGLKWIYNEGERETVWTCKKAGDDFQLDRATGGKNYSFTLRGSAEGVRIVAEEGKAVDPAPWLLKFPLKEGDGWETRFSGAEWKAQVGKSEEVEVPAGKFKCATVAFASKDGKSGYTLWLAKDQGVVKAVARGDKGTVEDKLRIVETPK